MRPSWAGYSRAFFSVFGEVVWLSLVLLLPTLWWCGPVSVPTYCLLSSVFSRLDKGAIGRGKVLRGETPPFWLDCFAAFYLESGEVVSLGATINYTITAYPGAGVNSGSFTNKGDAGIG